MLNAGIGYGQDIKSLLLKGVTQLPMPTEEEPGVAAFFTINETPEIIALTKVEVGTGLHATVIMSSTLGKGHLLLLGSPAYFGSTQLQNSSVRQLLKNAMNLSGSRPRIALFGKYQTPFKNFLKDEGGKTNEISAFNISSHTDILILTEDITNPDDLDKIERFIRKGGTLWFASPLGTLTAKDQRMTDRGINSLLIKAGVYNYDMFIRPTKTNSILTTDSIPYYLHIKTLFTPHADKVESFEHDVAQFFINPMLDLVFKYNAIDAPMLKTIKEYYFLPDTIRIPTPEKPILLPTAQHKAGVKVLFALYEKKMDFKNHPTAKAKGSENFPGAVPKAAQRVKATVQVAVKVGTQGLADPPSVYYRGHSTGYYIPAGEKVKISINKDLLKLGLIAQIGVHGDDVMHLDKITRYATDLIRKFTLNQETTEVYSPFGGLLLLNIPDDTKLDTISFNIDGAVKAPYFKLGETTESEWINSIRNYPGPWAELATDNIVLTVPSYRIRALYNPVKLMKFWDEVMDADAELAAISKKRVHQERIIVDNDVAYGYMFTTWDRIVVPDDQSCEWMLNEEFIRKNGSWGTFHELGHRHQFAYFDFEGTGEVTVNLYTMYIYDKVLGKGLYNHDNLKTKQDVIRKIKAYLANHPSYEKWSADPFLALSMYIQIIDQFGWDAILNVHRAYRKMPASTYPKTDQDKRDLWFVNVCKSTNRNLTKFFDVWKVPVSEQAKKQVINLKPWFPEELM
jgi:hypothetical protein